MDDIVKGPPSIDLRFFGVLDLLHVQVPLVKRIVKIMVVSCKRGMTGARV
jgi:hypothetical protein